MAEPPVFDMCAFIGESLYGHGQSPDELLARMDTAGVNRCVVCPAKPPNYHLGPATEAVAAAAQKNPRFIAFARIDPHQGQAALQQLEHAAREYRVAGLFLHPWEETFRINSPIVDPLASRAVELGLHLLVATGYPWVSEAPQVGELARRFPSLQIVMTHGGQINISGLGQFDAWQVLQQRPNVSIETSGVYRQDFIEEVVNAFGPERVLFGSSSPWMDTRLEIERIRRAKIPDDSKQLILGVNAARLLGCVLA